MRGRIGRVLAELIGRRAWVIGYRVADWRERIAKAVRALRGALIATKAPSRRTPANDAAGGAHTGDTRPAPVDLPNLARADLNLAVNGLLWKGFATQANVDALICLLHLEDA